MDAVLAQQPIAGALPFLQNVCLHGFAMNVPLKHHQKGLLRVDESIILSPSRSCLATKIGKGHKEKDKRHKEK